MSEFFSRFDPGETIGLVAVVGGLLCGSITIVAFYWHKIRQTELKKQMLDRGLSAEEIKTVLEAGWKN